MYLASQAGRSNIIGVSGVQTAVVSGESDEKHGRDIPVDMVGKEFTIVVKGPRTCDIAEYPIEYGK